MQIGVLGGTGPAGSAVALRLASAGVSCLLGSRSAEKSAEKVGELLKTWPSKDLSIQDGTNEDAAEADMVILATPWEGALDLVASLRNQLSGKTLISMVNALTRWGGHMVPLVPPTGSVAMAVATTAPGAHVVAAFHHLPAGLLADLDHQLEADVLCCGDDRGAVEAVGSLIERVPGLRGIYAGGLGSALALEAMTAALLEVNRRYKTHASLRITGLSESQGVKGEERGHQ